MSDSPTPHWRLLEPLRPTERAAVLAATTRRRFGRGDTIFFEGDPGESVHLLASGRVAIRAATPGGDTVTYAIAGPGDAFGEMALLGRDNRRTATVLALEPVETFVLLQEQFEVIRGRHPGVDRMLVETDSPFLAPVPHRGRKNEPAHVVETARKVAELKGVTLEELAAITTATASGLFGLSVS